MSSILDPSGGDGPNKGGLNPSEDDRAGGPIAEDSEEGGRVEDDGAEGVSRPSGEETKTASKGINPVQHSE